ncbi:Unknown protein sequence [Pseudomonas amygdali pv. lachrymans]|uniref:Uncharacterized protein n=1 Tax=Pseudomonas amygdali pv. lachrymans TaxID=53707 RepID=A0ABR5KRT9_PSEAV|nr:Unknown protein sequence [Pseudomonas amygdali pv. lachrymans]
MIARAGMKKWLAKPIEHPFVFWASVDQVASSEQAIDFFVKAYAFQLLF